MTSAPLVLCVALLGVAPAAFGQTTVIWNEGSQGDLSNDRFAPTALGLSLGTNQLIGTVQGGDRDYVALTVPAGMRLSGLVHALYVSQDTTGFIAVQNGAQMTWNVDSFDPTGVDGYTHFSAGTVNTDILPGMGTGPGANGFVPPLGAGTYTFLIQQLGALTQYQFNFNVTQVPAPAGASLALAGLGLLGRRRRP